MRIAALYDIHGNLPALEAVLEDVRRADVDAIVVGGDVVPGPMPRETVERLLALDIPAHYIHGNGDRVVLAAMRGIEPDSVPEAFREPIRWSARQLQPEHEVLLAGWPSTRTIRIDGVGDVLLCHATPRNDTEIFTRRTSDARVRPAFRNAAAAVVVCGHTHMQFDRSVDGLRIVNAGSVGMPFAAPGAYWLVVGPDIQLRYTAYDLARAAERIRHTRYPHAEDFAARNVLNPPSEAAMLDAFAAAELKEEA